MKVVNIHKRTINQPKSKLVNLLKTLSTEDDKVWPYEKWPAMKFRGGIQIDAKGGHGPIRYSVDKYNPNEIIQFRFSKPNGFNGIHKFELNELAKDKTEIKHTIDMDTTAKGTLLWILVIRYTHHALMEDGFDKVQNQFSQNKKSSEWSAWVRILRSCFKMIRNLQR